MSHINNFKNTNLGCINVAFNISYPVIIITIILATAFLYSVLIKLNYLGSSFNKNLSYF